MIFIPYNVPSLKNSKKIVKPIGMKHPMLIPSDTVFKYLNNLGIKKIKNRLTEKEKRMKVSRVVNLGNMHNLFKSSIGDYFKDVNKPAIVRFHFVRDSKRRFDFHNAVQILADLFVSHGYLYDDDMEHFIPVPMSIDGRWYTVDKTKPGVFIKIDN